MIVCNNIKEVETATEKLDKASIVPLFIRDAGVEKEVDNFVGIYNNSTGTFCSAVTKNYNLIQHKEYINNFAKALDRLNIKYKMKILPEYNKVYCDVDFINKKHKFENLNEEFMTGIRLVNSYNKTTGLGILPRYTRLACSNGMIISRYEKTFSIKHTSKILTELEKFIETRINMIINKDEELKVWVSASMKDSAEWNVITQILEKLMGQLTHREEVLKKLGISVITKDEKGKKKKKADYILEKDAKKKITRWELYNAITSHLTHGEHITPHVEMFHQKNAEKILITPLIELAK